MSTHNSGRLLRGAIYCMSPGPKYWGGSSPLPPRSRRLCPTGWQRCCYRRCVKFFSLAVTWSTYTAADTFQWL